MFVSNCKIFCCFSYIVELFSSDFSFCALIWKRGRSAELSIGVHNAIVWKDRQPADGERWTVNRNRLIGHLSPRIIYNARASIWFRENAINRGNLKNNKASQTAFALINSPRYAWRVTRNWFAGNWEVNKRRSIFENHFWRSTLIYALANFDQLWPSLLSYTYLFTFLDNLQIIIQFLRWLSSPSLHKQRLIILVVKYCSCS